MCRVLFFIIFLFCSCHNDEKRTNTEVTENGKVKDSAEHHIDLDYQQLGNQFLLNIYDGNYRDVISNFDSIVKEKLTDGQLRKVFTTLSAEIRNQYKSSINTTLISSEKTIHENLPSTFLIFKIESKEMFGYYFFYMNDLTRKVILFSEFSKVKEKRK